MEEEESGGKLLWIILFALALVAAIVFAVLWYLRGDDVDRLRNAVATNQSVADAAAARLERELRTARSDVDAGNRRVAELENRVRDEQRRSADAAQQVERRLRGDVDAANIRVRDLNAQVTRLQDELAVREAELEQAGEQAKQQAAQQPAQQPASAPQALLAAAAPAPAVATAGLLPLRAQLASVRQHLKDARASAREREESQAERLAGLVRAKEEVERERDVLAGTVGDLKASLNNVGLELTTANEDLRKMDSVSERADALEKELAASRADATAAKSDATAARAEAASAGADAKRLGEDVKRLEEKVGDLEANNSHLRNELSSSQDDLRAALEASQKQAGRADGIEGELARAREAAADLEKRHSLLDSDHGNLRGVLAEARKNLRSAQESSRENADRAGRLEAELERANASLADLQKRHAQLDSDHGGLRKELAAAGAAAAAAGVAAVKIHELETKLAQAEQNLADAREGGEKLIAATHTLNGQLAERQRELERVRAEASRAADAERELAAAKKTAEELRGRIGVFETEHESLRRDISDIGLELQNARADAIRAPLLANELDAAKKGAESLKAQIAELETQRTALRRDLAAAMADLRSAGPDGKGLPRVSELENRITGLTRELDDARRENAGSRDSVSKLRTDLDRARRDSAEREKALRDGIEQLRRENRALRQLAGADAGPDAPSERADAAADAKPGIAGVHEAIAKLEARVAEAGVPEELRKARRELSDARAAAGDLEEKLKALEENNRGLRKELDSFAKDLWDCRDNAAKNLAAVKKDYDERLAGERERHAERERDLLEGFERERAEWEKRPSGVGTGESSAPVRPVSSAEPAGSTESADPAESPESSESPQPVESEVASASAAGSAAAAVLPPPPLPPPPPPISETPAGAAAFLLETPTLPTPESPPILVDLPVEPVHYFIRDPMRSVGEISEILPNGRYRVSGGSRQGVRPDMLFDVHRPLGGMNWFIGVLRVERTMQDASEAILIPCPGVKICPVTGRAVLAPGARYSPFVFADGGRNVPLISAESLGLGGEMPSVGDRIDNPFYDPAGRFDFAVSPELGRDDASLVRAAARALGGRTLADGELTADADYVVVPDARLDVTATSPGQITAEQLASYVSPDGLSYE